ncbi:hypothetical protein [Mesorhizobium sp.]|uniref:hypothetical protein n=1 Tax=Mesorhizobium sp. TaxID=1871066 RepID=UPI000FE81CF2|nr:hypothetical protein [Mesorhizobium sp.]RWO22845.1 MAG: hypothetical protein EOS09_19450 [Mesorhizobium sp.]
MGSYHAPLSAPIVLHEDQESLLDLRANVHPDGDATSFSIALTNQRPFKLMVPFEEMAPILNEIRYASNLMVKRQRLKLDRGAEKMMALVQHALKPFHTEIIIDPANGDRVFILLFEDHAPLAIRKSVADMHTTLRDLARVTSRSGH